MALGSWTGLYIDVIDKLMDQRRDKELLMLLAIQRHCDPLGFCFPGRASLFKKRHCSKDTQLMHEGWLEDNGYITVSESYNPRRRRFEPDYHVSPRVLYVRPEMQDYCEKVFDGVQARDFAYESAFLVTLSSTEESVSEGGPLILFSTKESQPESYPESETRIRKQNQGTSPKTRKNNQLAPRTENANSVAPRLHESPHKQKKQRVAQTQATAMQNRKNNPQAGGPDEFEALLDVDDDRMAKEIEIGVGTTPHQAARAVRDYSRELLVHWLRMAAIRRQKGTLDKPAAWFFAMIKANNPLITLQDGNPDSVISAYTGRGI